MEGKREAIMLNIEELQAIRQLQKECEAYDHFQLKLNWEMLRSRESRQHDFFHYEDNQLIAFLGLYAFGSTVEICGMVKPSARRKGHFKRIAQQGINTAITNGYKKILLNTPAGSDAAKGFLNQIAAKYAFSEHQMTWKNIPQVEPSGVSLRPTTTEDLEMRVRLSIEAFGESEEDARAMEADHNRSNDSMFMIEAMGEIVGKVHVNIDNSLVHEPL